MASSRVALTELMRELPDDEACLQWLWRGRHAEGGMRAMCPEGELGVTYKTACGC